MATATCASSRSAHEPSCSGETTSTSWIPRAGAWVQTGPRFCTTSASRPVNAGYRLGTTRTSQWLAGP
jgi:hypothetical protein